MLWSGTDSCLAGMSPESSSPLHSPSLGAGLGELDELIGPCRDTLRPHPPIRVEGRPTFGLTFSGGGFRATLAALGVARFLADAGRLGDVRFISSVSGGSIASGMLACRWGEMRGHSFSTQVFDAEVIGPFVESIMASSLKGEVLRNLWRAIGPRTRTDLLARVFDDRFFHGRTLDSLDDGCRFVINAANLMSGVRFAFERDVLGDYLAGLAKTDGTGMKVALAVAASAAVPGAFAPIRLQGITFPCGDRGDPMLLDGGAYDNTGLEAFDGNRYRDVFLITMNAGGVFVTGRWGGVPIVRDLARSNSLLYRQSTSLRTRWMVERFRASEEAAKRGATPPMEGRTGVLMGLATNVNGAGAERWRATHPEHRTWHGKDLAFVPTVFDKLDPALCRLLIYRGWWLLGATLSQYHPDIVDLPPEVPPRR